MKLASLIIVAAAAATALAEGVIDFTKLPACAKQCTVLVNADSSCVPPQAPVTSQATYQSCVCQSTLLTTLKTSGALCASVCTSTDDQNSLSTYYVSLCNGPVVQPAATTTTATTTTGTSSTTSTTSTATGGAAAGAGNSAKQTSAGSSWLSSHARWVAFIVVVAVFLVVGLVGGTWWKRRHDRKMEAKKANVAAKIAVHSDKSYGNGGASPYTNYNGHNTTTPPPVTMSGGRSGMNMDSGVGGIAPPRPPTHLRTRTNTIQSMSTANGSKGHLPHQPVAWGPHQYQAYAKEYGSNSPVHSVPPSPTVPVEIPRPHTTGGAARAVTVNHGLQNMHSDPGLNPAAEPYSAEISQVSPKKLRKQHE